MINVFFTSFEKQLSHEAFSNLVNSLPISMQEQVLRFKQWKDTHLVLFGKLLLDKASKELFHKDDILSQIQYTEYKRPFYSEFDFNISHSDNVVVVAISGNSKVGIDIEKIQEVDYLEFSSVFTDEENASINLSPNPLYKFYEYWTKKEAVIKADGRGMNLLLDEISVLVDDIIEIDGIRWYTNKLFVADNFMCHLASDKICDNIIVKKISFNY